MDTSVIIVSFALPAVLSCILSLSLMKFSTLQKNFNHIDKKDFKEKKIPRIGGIAIVLSLIISLIFLRIAFSPIFIDIEEDASYSLFFLAVLVIFALGIYDDVKGAEAVKKFLLQIIAAILIYFAGFKIAEVSVPFLGTKSLGFDFLSFLLTIIWVVGVTNAVNIMDGLDGLAVGVSFFAALSMGILAFMSAQFHIVVMIVVLLGAMIGFYPFNFPRAKIYLGDSGSMVIGFLLAVLSISKIHRKVSLAISLMIPIIILFLPILETLVTIARRASRRQNIFTGDTDHFHYRFLKKGFSETKATLLLMFMSFLFSMAGILFNFIQTRFRLLLFVLICLIGFFLLHYLGYYSFFAKKKEQTPDE
jgi:UDP-GlcNAc:undecaprenyl-phosphate GlcNAc-1-phosphate transferase